MNNRTFTHTLAAGVVLAGLTLSHPSRADVEVLFAGGNASQTVLYDRVTNIFGSGSTLTSVVISPTNSTVRTYRGTLPGQDGLGIVTIDFSLLGAVGGFQDLANQNSETTANTNSLAPTVAVSSTSPEAVAIDPSPFTQTRTLVVPFVFVKNPSRSPALANVTNLTQRQAAYLEGAAGYLPASFFGGTNSAPVYLVARNTATAAERKSIDSNIDFNGTISTWVTNQAGYATHGGVYTNTAIGLPVPDPNGGQGQRRRGSSTGQRHHQRDRHGGRRAGHQHPDASQLRRRSWYLAANVENGSYPIWGFERWAYLKSSQALPAPTNLRSLTRCSAR